MTTTTDLINRLATLGYGAIDLNVTCNGATVRASRPGYVGGRWVFGKGRTVDAALQAAVRDAVKAAA